MDSKKIGERIAQRLMEKHNLAPEENVLETDDTEDFSEEGIEMLGMEVPEDAEEAINSLLFERDQLYANMDAEREGFYAFLEGKSFEDNPYAELQHGDAWSEGYISSIEQAHTMHVLSVASKLVNSTTDEEVDSYFEELSEVMENVDTVAIDAWCGENPNAFEYLKAASLRILSDSADE